jgi:quinol monooxygenase YgiN
MKDFLGSAFPIMTTGFDLQHYSLVGGFIDGPGDKRPCGIMYDTNIVCKSAEARQKVVQRLKALGSSVTKDNKDGILSFMTFEAQDDTTGARMLGRFTDRKALDAFMRRPEVVKFWADGKESDIARIEQRGYVENGKGWLHRG